MVKMQKKETVIHKPVAPIARPVYARTVREEAASRGISIAQVRRERAAFEAGL